MLSAQSLIRTTKGSAGGSFVITPSADYISEFLTSNISLLSRMETVSLDEFLELREMLEVPAARLAARHRDAGTGQRLTDAIPECPHDLGNVEQFAHNRDCHAVLVDASQNTLLAIAAQPLFIAMQTSLDRSRLGRPFHRQINEDHRRIAAAIIAGDEEAAAGEMRLHLERLRPEYEHVWRGLKRARDATGAT